MAWTNGRNKEVTSNQVPVAASCQPTGHWLLLPKLVRNMTENFAKAASVSELPVGGRKLVEIDGVRIAIFNLDGDLHAIEDVCTHDGGPLVEGEVTNVSQVECPRHGARFDIRTGAALCMPAFEATNTYAVEIDGDDIFVERPF